MATAKKLESGKWSCRVFVGYTTKDGKKKRVYKRITADGKREAEFQARRYLVEHQGKLGKEDLTVQEAIDKYIAIKENVLSLTTLMQYHLMANRDFTEISDIPLSDLDKTDVQLWVSNMSSRLAPKTVKNSYVLLSSAVKMFADKHFEVTLPEQMPKAYRVPSAEEVKFLISQTGRNRNLRLAIMLAAYCSLRRGEALAVEYSDVDYEKGEITIDKAIVRGEDGRQHVKTPKDRYSVRKIPVPDHVMAEIGHGEGRIIPVTTNAITSAFMELTAKHGMKGMRFHDLRHFYASYLHAQGIPDAYIEKFGGWAPGSKVMRKIYRNTLDEETEKNKKAIKNLFS